MGKKLKIYPRNKRHFRGHKDFVNGEIKYHPNYVFGETDSDYYSFGITEEKRYDKKHNNHPLTKNPNTSKTYKESYIHKKAKSDIKDNYTGKYHNYKFHPEDKKYIDNKIDKKYQ
jgi:hypothetical protein